MIDVRVELRDGHTAIVVDGHEGHVYGGQVCAAVSAITQTAIAGLLLYAQEHPDVLSIDIQETP